MFMTTATFLTTTFQPGQFASAWSYLTDAHGMPCEGTTTITDDSVICESPEKSFSLNLLVEIKDFGKIVARTNVVSGQKENFDLLSGLIQGRVDQIEQELAKPHSTITKHAQQLSELKKQPDSMSKLSALMQLGEDIVFENAQARLDEKITKGETQNFLIGGQTFGIEKSPEYKKIHAKYFDLGIAPLYFFLLKPESQEKTNWELTDKIVAWLVETGRPIKAHPLVWLHKYARPDWMLSLSFDELKVFIQDHIRQVIARYGEHVKMWDIVNEIPCFDANGFDLNIEQLLELTKMISELVKELQPEAERIMNFSEIFGAHTYVHDKPGIPPVHFLKLCEEYGIEYEAIGLQFYMGMKKEFACRELMNLSQLVDDFAQFGKIIHFSELGWPSKHDVDPTCFFSADHPEVAGRWHRGWDEELQAEFVEKVYTIFASKPKAKSITWWDLTDHGLHQDIGSRFIPFSGLTRRDYSPKPALLKIQEIREKLHRVK
jgi:GH35 family endo-1,4-beta-xylanase